ncbi:hypothetical protein [Granulibacter bethesdensis]|uniref:hypothetical protein n=1 Tax=Granulibacter bethesdensis TaxID=364410 RepID=UPI0003267DAE|nr:hypothetical protein [Granulibacter bethesdensis]
MTDKLNQNNDAISDADLEGVNGGGSWQRGDGGKMQWVEQKASGNAGNFSASREASNQRVVRDNSGNILKVYRHDGQKEYEVTKKR